MPKASAGPADYQAVVAVPGDAAKSLPAFALGIRASDKEITGIDFLPSCRPRAATNAVAAEAARQIGAWLENPAFVFDLPLWPQGTPFQRRVWQAIARIPPGDRRRYGDLARSLRSGARAVGGACGANPYPIVVPCHRVVAAAGGLGGFGGAGAIAGSGPRGALMLAIKHWLLAHEAE